MAAPRFIFTNQYSRALEAIEDFIFSTTNSLEQVERFLDEHDGTLEFIAQNPGTAAIHPMTGDQSWIFGSGRYRVFYRCVVRGAQRSIFS